MACYYTTVITYLTTITAATLFANAIYCILGMGRYTILSYIAIVDGRDNYIVEYCEYRPPKNALINDDTCAIRVHLPFTSHYRGNLTALLWMTLVERIEMTSDRINNDLTEKCFHFSFLTIF